MLHDRFGGVLQFRLLPVFLLLAITPNGEADSFTGLEPLAAKWSDDAVAEVGSPPVSDVDSVTMLRSSLGSLEKLLDRSASGPDWKRYLDWPALEQLSKSQPIDLQNSKRFEQLFAAGHDGLQMREFADVHRALRRVVALRERDQTQSFTADIRKLKEILAAKDNVGKPSRLREVGPLLERLADAGVASSAVSATRDRLWQSNVLLDVEERLMADASRPVDETAPVDEVILGVRNRGMGTTTGAVRVDFVPASATAAFDLVFEAVNQSRTRGGQRGVTVCTSGTTALFAKRRVIVDARVVTGLPVFAHADTDTQTEGIGVSRHIGRGIIRRIAGNRANQMRPRAEQISAGRSRDRLAGRFGRETDRSIGSFSGDLENRLWRPLTELGLYPARMEMSTSDTTLEVKALEALSDQIGASTPPPANDPDAVLSARVHSTALENAATIRFSGRRMVREDVENFFAERDLDVPEALRELPRDGDDAAGDGDDEGPRQDDGEKSDDDRSKMKNRPWAATFERDRPIEIVTENDLITVRLRFSDMQSGDNAIGPMEVAVSYRVERDASGARMVRTDKTLNDILVAPPGGQWSGQDGPSPRERVIRLRLRRRIDRALPRVIDEPLELSGSLASAGPLPLEHMAVTEDGWIAIGWRSKDRPIPGEVIPAGEPTPAVARIE